MCDVITVEGPLLLIFYPLFAWQMKIRDITEVDC